MHEQRPRYGRLVTLGLLLLTAAGPVGAQDDGPTANPARQAFTVGVEDQLGIFVWGEEALSVSGKVRPDGKITVPLVHDVEVVGLTPEQIRVIITERLSKYIRDPNVTVSVEAINSFRVYFIGEVATRGAIQFFRPIRVLQAIAVAGGPTDFAKNEITLLREEFGVERRFQIDYKKLLAGDPSQENIYLRPDDTLIFR